MKPVRSLTPAILPLCLLIVLLTACMPKSGGEAGPAYVEIYYIDDPNGFAMEYPADWTKVRKAPSSVAWQPPPGDAGAAEVMATVTSFSPTDVPGGADRMLSDFAAAHPGFVLTSEEPMDGPGGTPALRVMGHTPNRDILAYFITTHQRAFILEFSASSQWFESYRPIFEEMADSFRVLE